MKATITSKGQMTIPKSIRDRMGLKAGDVLEFDEQVTYLKAQRVFDQSACVRLRVEGARTTFFQAKSIPMTCGGLWNYHDHGH